MEQFSTPLLFLALAVGLYFLIIRPSRARQRAQAKMIAEARPGAEIRTIGGLFGRITHRDDNRIHLEVAPGVTLVFLASAIAEIIEAAPEPLVVDE